MSEILTRVIDARDRKRRVSEFDEFQSKMNNNFATDTTFDEHVGVNL